MMKRALLPVAGFCAALALAVNVTPAGGNNVQPAGPMPPASPVPAAPSNSDPARPAVVQATRVEIVDATGRVAAVLTSEGSVPVAIVNDNGTARRIDLAKVARMVK